MARPVEQARQEGRYTAAGPQARCPRPRVPPKGCGAQAVRGRDEAQSRVWEKGEIRRERGARLAQRTAPTAVTSFKRGGPVRSLGATLPQPGPGSTACRARSGGSAEGGAHGCPADHHPNWGCGQPTRDSNAAAGASKGGWFKRAPLLFLVRPLVGEEHWIGSVCMEGWPPSS